MRQCVFPNALCTDSSSHFSFRDNKTLVRYLKDHRYPAKPSTSPTEVWLLTSFLIRCTLLTLHSAVANNDSLPAVSGSEVNPRPFRKYIAFQQAVRMYIPSFMLSNPSLHVRVFLIFNFCIISFIGTPANLMSTPSV